MCFIHNALHFINQVTALIDFRSSVSNTQRMEKIAGESIGQRVRRIREYNEWSLVQVERQSGGRITNGYISRIENGHETNLSVEAIFALADGLKVPPSVLLETLFDNKKNNNDRTCRT